MAAPFNNPWGSIVLTKDIHNQRESVTQFKLVDLSFFGSNTHYDAHGWPEITVYHHPDLIVGISNPAVLIRMKDRFVTGYFYRVTKAHEYRRQIQYWRFRSFSAKVTGSDYDHDLDVVCEDSFDLTSHSVTPSDIHAMWILRLVTPDGNPVPAAEERNITLTL